MRRVPVCELPGLGQPPRPEAAVSAALGPWALSLQPLSLRSDMPLGCSAVLDLESGVSTPHWVTSGLKA